MPLKFVTVNANVFQHSASMGLRPPDPLPGFRPWTPLGDFRPQTPHLCSSKISLKNPLHTLGLTVISESL